MKKVKMPQITTILLIIVLVGFVLAQGMPFFTYGNGETISIANYLAFPTNYPEVTEAIGARVDGYYINDILFGGVAIPLLAVVLVVLQIKFSGNAVVIASTGAWGLCGLISYGINPVLKLGGSAWTLSIVFFLMALALSVGYLAVHLWERRPVKEESGENEKHRKLQFNH